MLVAARFSTDWHHLTQNTTIRAPLKNLKKRHQNITTRSPKWTKMNPKINENRKNDVLKNHLKIN